MKKTVITLALAAITMMTVSCSSQKKKSNKSNKPEARQQRSGGGPDITKLLAEMDTNTDGKLSKSEAKGPLLNNFAKIDTNKDGFLSREELANAPKPQGGRPGGGGQRPQRN
ncbi:EF-hand domain-containing protein [Arcticibacterium luteifluviistationis]|uniref:EF-hand domain-containing protein n=1 Tax=Arcticibacterium luteifluviistationis TaxID=1784714 RepID=A0A2Z4G8V9_9BACT|nr:EF-hand domain-containing protein [Arcticibacterium luteifluviistationis]AWV97520.1 hypothetical protein DJ013_04810 [Arcticibacterium luteifluviistationis]